MDLTVRVAEMRLRIGSPGQDITIGQVVAGKVAVRANGLSQLVYFPMIHSTCNHVCFGCITTTDEDPLGS